MQFPQLFASTIICISILISLDLALAAPLTRRSNVGQATFFQPGIGACGELSTGYEFIAATAADKFECGRQVRIVRGDKSVLVTIKDKCPGCGPNDLDLAPAAFREIGTEVEGRIEVEWDFV